jgi:hypothetical protein
VYVEVDSNPNCEGSVFLRFREQGTAKPVFQVRIYDRISTGEWCSVTGINGESPEELCQAWAQTVEDSGAGIVYLVWGGRWGLRLKPVASHEEWRLDEAGQWGEPYLLLADLRDIRFAEDTSGRG